MKFPLVLVEDVDCASLGAATYGMDQELIEALTQRRRDGLRIEVGWRGAHSGLTAERSRSKNGRRFARLCPVVRVDWERTFARPSPATRQ
jgi:hypothetical protein